MTTKTISWLLRLAVAGEFFGHGMFAVGGKAQWVGWIQELLKVDAALAGQILLVVGVVDLALALIVLVRPIRGLLLWMVFWGFATALVRPLVGEPIWDFVERWANWGAPLALYYITGKR